MPGATEVAQRARTTSPRTRKTETRLGGGAPVHAATPVSARTVGIRVEIYGLVVLVFALIVMLSLISFHPADVDKEARAALGGVQNWIGPVGAHIANLFLLVVGVAAFALDLVLVGLGICVLIGFRPNFGGRDLVIAGIGLLSTVILLHLCFDGQRVLGYPAGGYLGAYAGEGTRMLLSTAGTAIVSVTVLMISVMLLTGKSVTAFGRTLVGAIREFGDSVRKRSDNGRGRPKMDEYFSGILGEAPNGADDGDQVAPFPELAERPKKRDERPRTSVVHEPLISERRFVEEAGGLKIELEKTSLDLKPMARDVADEENAERLGGSSSTDKAAVTHDDRLAATDQVNGEPRRPSDNVRPRQIGIPSQSAIVGAPAHEPKIIESAAMRRSRVGGIIAAEQEKLALGQPTKEWELPPLSFLPYEPPKGEALSKEVLKENAQVLEQKLLDFGVQGKVVEIHPGPVVTMYEFRPAPGVKISKIANLADDLTMALAAMRIRIVAPIPGKSVVGIEVPNKAREMVYLKEVFSDDSFRKSKGILTLALGKDIVGYPQCADLSRMPHLLVAGSTGSGKSVALNSFICSILYKACPQEVRLIMVDPKMLELSVYEGIPHLLLPVVTDPKQAATALKWAVGEMERRYRLLANMGVRNIASYNTKIDRLREDTLTATSGSVGRPVTIVLDDADDDDGIDASHDELTGVDEIPEKLPYIVVIIDELADLMMVASKDVETSIARLAQMARAAGIHLILATQRPSVDVITGLIKANFPARMSFQVSSKIDSRTILDRQGAENLLGQGDMLYIPPGTSKLTRVHGAYIGDDEIEKITRFLKAQGRPQYCMEILAAETDGVPEEPIEYDEFYDQAVAIVAETRQASISYLQRRLKIGYNRAARIVEIMEKEGIVGPQHGPGPREVLIDPV